MTPTQRNHIVHEARTVQVPAARRGVNWASGALVASFTVEAAGLQMNNGTLSFLGGVAVIISAAVTAGALRRLNHLEKTGYTP